MLLSPSRSSVSFPSGPNKCLTGVAENPSSLPCSLFPPSLLPPPLSDPGIALTIYGRYVTMDNPLPPPSLPPFSSSAPSSPAKKRKRGRESNSPSLSGISFNGANRQIRRRHRRRSRRGRRPPCVRSARRSSYLMNHRHRRWRSCPPTARLRLPPRWRGAGWPHV